ncbi:SRPBCC family protein [Streptomyces sp. NBC_00841]|uniref:SRPBCC family protein n=1 Tax=unclassified Streptomyces TaxID=2593676 RepID=UPI00224CBB59|nr:MULTISPECIES: SRPBCC family protein [unclassified Streptomyces]MCX4537046.1 SRPBCC family protein [Streptomyces sp. NBC_01669]WRZ97709.1 SRPBCC family protein [Streptomyces sp. NBC_00841]
MQLHNSFTVPVPVDEAWRALLDIERVSHCMPGATVEDFDGETIKGSAEVQVGPITVTYRGTATFLEKDEPEHLIVLAAKGKEVRGQGMAAAAVTGTLVERGGGTTVTVDTDLTITGRPAQFGRGVMSEVSDGLIGQFAGRLSAQLSEAAAAAHGPAAQNGAAEPAARGPVSRTGAAEPEPAAPLVGGGTGAHEAEPVDLPRRAGAPVAERAAAVLGAAALAALVVVLLRAICRRRGGHGRSGEGPAGPGAAAGRTVVVPIGSQPT